MNPKLGDHKIDNFHKQSFPRPTRSPIDVLRNSFKRSLAFATHKKIPKEVENIITFDLTPTHIKGDFTFSVFEIAKMLNLDHFILASDIAKNLKSNKKYVNIVEVVDGYINVSIKPETFYLDSLRYVLNGNLLQEMSKSNKLKTILLLSEQEKEDDIVNQLSLKYVNRLYAFPPYNVKTVAIHKSIRLSKTRSFLRKAVKLGVVKNFGNNVMAINLSQEKYALLQRQDKTSTPLMRQLTSLNTYVKKNNPAIIIFSLNIIPSHLQELLDIAHILKIFKDGVRIVIMSDSDIENRINLHHYDTLKNLQADIEKILHSGRSTDLKNPIQFTNIEMEVARFISYAPEIFRRLLSQTSPKVIINYNESLKSPIRELYRFMDSASSQEAVSNQLLNGVYKILNTSLSLIEK